MSTTTTKTIDARKNEDDAWQQLCKLYRRKSTHENEFAVKPSKFEIALRHFSSRRKNIHKVHDEYELSYTEQYKNALDTSVYHCICSQAIDRWRYLTNKMNGNVLRIGHECVDTFIGENPKPTPADAEFIASDSESVEYEDPSSSTSESSDSSGDDTSDGEFVNEDNNAAQQQPPKSSAMVPRKDIVIDLASDLQRPKRPIDPIIDDAENERGSVKRARPREPSNKAQHARYPNLVHGGGAVVPVTARMPNAAGTRDNELLMAIHNLRKATNASIDALEQLVLQRRSS